MSFGSAEMQYVTRMCPMPRDLSHDIRTPLTVIRVQAQMLLRAARSGAFTGGATDPDRLLLGLQRIDDAVSRLSLVLNLAELGPTDDRRRLPGSPDGRASRDIH